MTRGRFVTATGTGIGKTFVTAALCRQLRARGLRVAALKPVITGYGPETAAESDTALLLRALGEAATETAIARLSPWRYAAALAPDMAAAREGRPLDYDALLAFCRAERAAAGDVLLIEGVGGVMVPLTERATVLDWMADLGLPALVVTGSYLGTLSHSLTALEVLMRRGIALAGLVVSESAGSTVPLDETAATLSRFLPGLPIRLLPRLGPEDAAPDLTDLVISIS